MLFSNHVIHRGTAIDASTILRRKRNQCVARIRMTHRTWQESDARKAWRTCSELLPGDDGTTDETR